ncbi:TetR/AcrR family transcriptional regulator [Streptomyces sodiiphilus]|uniref:TetR/AcrR family transcriptional regulator n=1 Tax=Streptomyces sodiiphilus TaxID=226217 RepID=A0ABP5AHY4_9ACTN
MNRQDKEPAGRGGGSGGKRRAVLDAARAVFGRVGYHAAGIDTIAAEARVSTRTIYNHFANKEQLFVTVVTESAARVADAHLAILEHHLGEVADLEADLVAFAQDWVRPRPEDAGHLALVRRIAVEGDDFPADLREAWRRAGPSRVRDALAERLTQLAERGMLRIDDGRTAARHFAALVSTGWSGAEGGPFPGEREAADAATAGVRAFLYGHLPRD